MRCPQENPWWHHHFWPAEIALSVASHPSAGTTSRRVTRHQRISFRYFFGPFGVHRIPFASFWSSSIHLSATTITHPLLGGHLISFFSCICRFWEGKHHLHCRATTPFSYRAAFGFYRCRLLHDTTLTLHVRLDVTGFLSC